MYIRNRLPRYQKPNADAIEKLSMAIIVDQKRLGGGSHSTMGTVTDISPVLRLLFSRIGKPYVGYANSFSFNDPQGMCSECNGIGRKIGVDPAALVDLSKSLNEGAIIAPGFSQWDTSMYIQDNRFDKDKKLSEFTKDEMEELMYTETQKVTVDVRGQPLQLTYEGVVLRFNRKFINRDI